MARPTKKQLTAMCQSLGLIRDPQGRPEEPGWIWQAQFERDEPYTDDNAVYEIPDELLKRIWQLMDHTT